MVVKSKKILFYSLLFFLFVPVYYVHAEYDGNPVVIVPGMLASFDKKLMLQDIEDNKWGFIWGGNVYKALIKELEMSGYEEGESLFIAYYDWRIPIEETYKKYLMPKIDEARAKSGKRKVDIVAHSMGGLLSRAYIQSDNYQDDVNKIVMMGTPNKGASEAYVVWEGGEYPESWDSVRKGAFDYMQKSLRKTRNLPNIQPPLSFREFFPSLRDLLPTTAFVKRDGKLLALSEMVEKNNFLSALNNNANLFKSRVKEARIYAGISGKTMDEVVIGGICTFDDNTNKRWRDGHPNPDPPVANSDEGDETVLLSSATLLDIENYSIEGTSHIKIPDDTRFSIPFYFNPPMLWYLPQPFRALAQNLFTMSSVRADGDEYVAPDSMLSFTVSPNVAFEVIDPAGKIISLDRNDLGEDNANFDDDPNDSEDIILVTIRNPKTGKYTLKLTGNITGDYYVDSTYVNDNGVFDGEREGNIKEDEEVIIEAEVSEDAGVDFVENETTVDDSPDTTRPDDNNESNDTNNESRSFGPNTAKDEDRNNNSGGRVLGTATVRMKLSATVLWVRLRLEREIRVNGLLKKDFNVLVGPLNDLLARARLYEQALKQKKPKVAATILLKMKGDYSDFANKVEVLIAGGKLNKQTVNVLTTLKYRLGDAGLR